MGRRRGLWEWIVEDFGEVETAVGERSCCHGCPEQGDYGTTPVAHAYPSALSAFGHILKVHALYDDDTALGRLWRMDVRK